jgi:lysosomal alpha-mannosidase
MTWNSWVHQIIRLFQNSSQAEIINIVGPIGIEDNLGKEVVTRFSSSLATDGVWFTDEQGRELIQRQVRKSLPFSVFLSCF